MAALEAKIQQKSILVPRFPLSYPASGSNNGILVPSAQAAHGRTKGSSCVAAKILCNSGVITLYPHSN